MSENVFLRMTVDVCVFTEDNPKAARLAKRLVKEASSSTYDERLGRELFDEIREGHIEIDAVSNVEDHTE